jgi:hypothetical protein
MSEQPPADAVVAETVAAVVNNIQNVPANQSAPADKYAQTPRLFGRKQPIHKVLGGGTSKFLYQGFSVFYSKSGTQVCVMVLGDIGFKHISSLILVEVLDSNLLQLCSCCDKQNGSVGSKLWIAKSEKRKLMSSQSKALFCRCLYMFLGIFLSNLHAS